MNNTPSHGTSGGVASATVPLWSLLLPPAALLLLLLVASQRPDGRLHLWVLDVGQGDAILLRTPRGNTALIDGGPGATPLLNGVGKELPFWQRNLNLVVLTHPHDDHLTGLVDLLGRYRVDEVVQTAFTPTTRTQEEWLRTLKDRAVTVYYARSGEEIGFQGEPDVSLRVLSPATPGAAAELKGGGLNNTSIVMKLSYGSENILLEGDAQVDAEDEMVRREAPELAAQVLKVGHHGSSTSSSAPFLKQVQPQVAIISVGAGNSYGHPTSQTLQALQKAGAKVLRTDQNGTIEVIADKNQMWVRSERNQ